jgi:hypothetical protein
MQGQDIVYQWCKDGEEIPGLHAKQATLLIEGPAVSDAGRYRVVVSNAGGTAKSIEALVHVRAAIEQILGVSELQRTVGDVGSRVMHINRIRRRRVDRQQPTAYSLSPPPTASARNSAVDVGAASGEVMRMCGAQTDPLPMSGAGGHHAEGTAHGEGTDGMSSAGAEAGVQQPSGWQGLVAGISAGDTARSSAQEDGHQNASGA